MWYIYYSLICTLFHYYVKHSVDKVIAKCLEAVTLQRICSAWRSSCWSGTGWQRCRLKALSFSSDPPIPLSHLSQSCTWHTQWLQLDLCNMFWLTVSYLTSQINYKKDKGPMCLTSCQQILPLTRWWALSSVCPDGCWYVSIAPGCQWALPAGPLLPGYRLTGAAVCPPRLSGCSCPADAAAPFPSAGEKHTQTDQKCWFWSPGRHINQMCIDLIHYVPGQHPVWSALVGEEL